MIENEIRDVFLTEAEELLKNLETEVVLLEEESDPDLINKIFRYIHTIKGSSGIAGFNDVYEFTHKLENTFDLVRQGELKVDSLIVDVILGSIDWIKAMIFGAEGDVDLLAARDKLVNMLNAVRNTGNADNATDKKKSESEVPAAEENSSRYYLIELNFRDNIFEFGIDPLLIVEDLTNYGIIEELEFRVKGIPPLLEMNPELCYAGWKILFKTDLSIIQVENIFLFVKDDNDIKIKDMTEQFGRLDTEQIESPRLGDILINQGKVSEEQLKKAIQEQGSENRKMGEILVEKGLVSEKDIKHALNEQEKLKSRIESSTVRVDARKLDRLMNLLGEIVIGQSSISRITDELEEEKAFRLKNALYSLDRVTREFQEQLMSIRMIPIGPTFEQFKRFVRDTAHALGKDIRFDIKGADTELDKTVIERIGDPLKHMIRNSIDHGIESSEERLAQGKSAQGVILLHAYHQEGNVYIELKDDGAGIDKVKVREKAESLGLVKKDEEISESRLISFIFLPGFSTAQKVGDLSGRGVGMDVVKNSIESLRGSVEIITTVGKGTTMRIKLPLTLAIIEGMMVRVGKNIFVIPLLSIVESMQPAQQDVKTVEGKGEVIAFRGEYVTLVRTYNLFSVDTELRNPWEGLVVIVESAGIRVGLMIDELLGQQQIVIKSLGNFITSSKAISGAAILGDGKVALIIDVHGLINDIV